MDTSIKWIKDLVPGLECTNQEFRDAMTLSGTKVECFNELDKNLDKIVVGQIVSVESKKGRPTKEPRMKKSTNPLPLTESEREELIRLRTENEYIKAENEVIKKRIALRQEKWVAQLKAKKQQSSKNSEKKDIN